MARFTITRHVRAPRDRVFDVFSDLSQARHRISAIEGLEILTDGPVGAGTRFRETRIVFKRETTEEMEITAFEPGRRYAVEAGSCGAHFITTFTFGTEKRPDGGDGTRVDVTFESRAAGIFARLMVPLGWLMKGQMRKAFEKDIDELAAAAESGSA